MFMLGPQVLLYKALAVLGLGGTFADASCTPHASSMDNDGKKCERRQTHQLGFRV